MFVLNAFMQTPPRIFINIFLCAQFIYSRLEKARKLGKFIRFQMAHLYSKAMNAQRVIKFLPDVR